MTGESCVDTLGSAPVSLIEGASRGVEIWLRSKSGLTRFSCRLNRSALAGQVCAAGSSHERLKPLMKTAASMPQKANQPSLQARILGAYTGLAEL